MSTISNLADDAEKIAGDLVAPGHSLDKIVGVLALHVEQIAGHELEHLTDTALGYEPEGPGTPAAVAERDAAEARAKELEAELANVRGQVTSPPPGEIPPPPGAPA